MQSVAPALQSLHTVVRARISAHTAESADSKWPAFFLHPLGLVLLYILSDSQLIISRGKNIFAVFKLFQKLIRGNSRDTTEYKTNVKLLNFIWKNPTALKRIWIYTDVI